jgi:hypothetical protein
LSGWTEENQEKLVRIACLRWEICEPGFSGFGVLTHSTEKFGETYANILDHPSPNFTYLIETINYLSALKVK